MAETLQAKIERLERENAALREKASHRQTISFKVSEKGALSVYGLGRFPVTLYIGQWERLIAAIPALQGFASDNAGGLARKE